MVDARPRLANVPVPMPTDLPTPAVVVDLARVEANVVAMAEHARAQGVALRPHAKTHKSPEVARLQVAAGAAGLTVATVGEAEVFAEAGFGDLFIAYPLWVDDARRHGLRALVDPGVRGAVGCDSAEGAGQLAGLVGVDVVVELDSGHHRSGVLPEEAGELAGRIAELGLVVRGAFTFPGHSYSPEGRESAARDEARALATAGEALRAAGVADPVLSGGSTPSLAHLTPGAATETRPGVYVFGDAQQWELGSCPPERIALTVHATVVSRRPGHVVLDAGSKALGADRAAWATGFGRLLDHPAARISQLSEHHAVVDWYDDEPLPALGQRLRVVPNHVCNTVNLADVLHTSDGATWPVAARGRNA